MRVEFFSSVKTVCKLQHVISMYKGQFVSYRMYQLWKVAAKATMCPIVFSLGASHLARTINLKSSFYFVTCCKKPNFLILGYPFQLVGRLFIIHPLSQKIGYFKGNYCCNSCIIAISVKHYFKFSFSQETHCTLQIFIFHKQDCNPSLLSGLFGLLSSFK